MIRRLAVIVLIYVGLGSSAEAQEYRFDIGGGIGMSGYMGEVNKNSLLHDPGFAGTLSFRYLMNYRLAIKGSFSTAGISGNTADFDIILPENQEYKFKSQLYDMGAQVEFNCFNYGIGYKYKNLHRLTPYITLGLGMTVADTNGEGAFLLNIPMGLGLKYKIKERLNMALEFTMRKAVGNSVDGFDLGEIYNIARPKNSNCYSLLLFTVSYEIGERCVECHYID